ncbi:MAG: hypothetical protein A2527_07585 [Candidatus Lambdaproteobacteria bacterium RIFOXYD2_FULL_50_16]|uniref:histidine kinase n=1 Tax=Candidatus Lambdaproteobacteria bacterium RIFOXYD2_FULL_50_16 TaxID=1817772 RepID=A0A1F6GB82_9PROT|nr:MAG: hypothetical protein A2527_07585 [Candidatus Lambdaproteobacteria bacterium RIFOXYD2_FULL_50_16]
MEPKKLLWQLFPGLLIIMLAALLLSAMLISNYYRDLFLKEQGDQMLARVKILQTEMVELIQEKRWIELAGLADRLGDKGQMRITLVDQQGRFLADSLGHLSTAEVLKLQPEIRAALRGIEGRSLRYGNTEQKQMLYVSLPINNGVTSIGALRLGVPVGLFEESLSWARPGLFWPVMGLGILAALACLPLVGKLTSPLSEIEDAARRFAKGELSHRLPSYQSFEFSRLARSLNEMAGQLFARFEEINARKKQQEAIFTGIGEGLLVLDEEGRVINLNPAALELLGLTDMRGKRLTDAARIPALEEFVKKSQKSAVVVSGQIEIFKTDRVVRATGSRLLDAQGGTAGVVLVLYDLTHLLKLENIRKEFVANVSHELKTPITSIKGFVETLLDGAKDDPEALDRFLKIIERQTGRLELIVEDLLSLARIEEKGFAERLQTTKVDLIEASKAAVQFCQHKARDKKMALVLNSSEVWIAQVNRPLIEQVLVNLIDNAVKYSPAGSKIELDFGRDGEMTWVAVSDQGQGISASDLPRIFERFYRVDKARSGLDSSTGLGLAIVKNIIELHQGRVEVKSEVGKGSRFCVLLPIV